MCWLGWRYGGSSQSKLSKSLIVKNRLSGKTAPILGLVDLEDVRSLLAAFGLEHNLDLAIIQSRNELAFALNEQFVSNHGATYPCALK